MQAVLMERLAATIWKSWPRSGRRHAAVVIRRNEGYCGSRDSGWLGFQQRVVHAFVAIAIRSPEVVSAKNRRLDTGTSCAPRQSSCECCA